MRFFCLILLSLFVLCACSRNSNQESVQGKAQKSQLPAPKVVNMVSFEKQLSQRVTKLGRLATGLTGGFDGVLGPRCSPEQLVWSNFFYLPPSPGIISQMEVEKVLQHPGMKGVKAFPVVLGDNFMNMPLVGALPEMFNVMEQQPGELLRMAEGRMYSSDRQEAVVGAKAAKEAKLKVGDVFQPCHGRSWDKGSIHGVEYVVVGILKESRTPVDIVIWIPLKGAQNMPGHSSETVNFVSAVYLKLGAGFNPVKAQSVISQINRNQNANMMVVMPVRVAILQGLKDMTRRMGWLEIWVKEAESTGRTAGEGVSVMGSN